MMEWRRSGLLSGPHKYIVHIDNDLFLSGTREFTEYLEEFVQGGYDFAGHLVSQATCDRYQYSSGTLAHVQDLWIQPATGPGDVATPNPHWETSYMILKTSLWESLTVEEVGHMRKFVIAMSQRGARMAAHKATYRWDYSAWGKEWFHLGHIMEKYSKLENSTPFAYGPESSFDKFRVGWLAFHKLIYPESNIFSKVDARLTELVNYFGGEKVILDYFHDLARGTCLENWSRYV
jgi:hypothetical protein